MSRLREVDLRMSLEVVQRLHAHGDADTLPLVMLEEVGRVVPYDAIGYTEVDPVARKSVGLVLPELWSMERLGELLAAHMEQHPVVMHFLSAHDGRAKAISDFQSRKEYHATGLYNELYRMMGVEDQLSIALPTGTAATIGVSISRARWGFQKRDRALLDLLRPHLLQVHEHARRVTELKKQLAMARGDWEVLPYGLIRVDGEMRVVEMSSRAREMVGNYFEFARGPERGDGTVVLPEELRGWMRANVLQHGAVNTVEGPRGKLVVRMLSAGGGILLQLEERGNGAVTEASLRSAGLTQRQGEIMRWVIEGKTNPEIGIILGISGRTVQKHLELVFRRLGVETRTAAIMRVLERTPGNSGF